jgi:hypothetical protein
MRKRKYNFKSILYGFIIGCVVGGSLVWWQKAYLIDRVLEKGFNLISIAFNKLNDSDEPSVKEKPETGNLKVLKTNSNTQEERYAIDAEVTAGTQNLGSDSTFFDSTAVDEGFNENISVVKEEMIYSKSLTIINLDKKKEAVSKADTIFMEENVGNNPEAAIYNIEIWKSPINFKGYKTGKNKIVLFGVYDFKKLSLKKINDVIYLQCDNNCYVIENTDDFRPLAVLSNKKLINQLSKK